MFIKNDCGKFLRADKIIAIKVFTGPFGTRLKVFTENNIMSMGRDSTNIQGQLDSLLDILKRKYHFHFLKVGEYYLVIEAIDYVNVDAATEVVEVESKNCSFKIQIPGQNSEFVIEEIRDQLPILLV